MQHGWITEKKSTRHSSNWISEIRSTFGITENREKTVNACTKHWDTEFLAGKHRFGKVMQQGVVGWLSENIGNGAMS